jgi:hypothetical protein
MITIAINQVRDTVEVLMKELSSNDSHPEVPKEQRWNYDTHDMSYPHEGPSPPPAEMDENPQQDPRGDRE